jgi:hypothetical protein
MPSDLKWDRKPWDIYWPTSGLRYGRSCWTCKRLLTEDDDRYCHFCRDRFARAKEEGDVQLERLLVER